MAELIIPASLREAHRKGLARLHATGEGRLLGRRLEMMAQRADGSEFPVELTITRISADGPPLYTGYVRDITERRRAEEERAEMLTRERESRAAAERAAERSRFLAEAGALLASSLDYEVTLGSVARLTIPRIADSCIVDLFNDDGTLKRVAVGGWDAEKEGLTRNFAERYPPDPEGPHPIMKVRRTGRSELIPEVSDEVLTRAIRTAEHLAQLRALGLRSALVVPLRARDHVLGALTLVSTKPGRRYGAEDVAFAEDLGYRAALAIENALLYREAHAANRMKDEFLATLSHELRTPLTSILGWVRMLRMGSVAGHRVAHGLEVVERNATAQARLIDDLLDVSRAIRGGVQLHIRALRLSSVVAAAVDTVRPSALARSIALHVEVAPAAEDVAGDPDRLQQVFWNLLSNAVRFTPPGGRVSIVALRAPTGVRVAVSDTGPGIAPELLPHVFERFRQGESRGRLPRGGLGLGLAIVRHLVEMHGGTVEATSSATDSGATGATFTVTLPAGETVGAGQP
jgi:signal transduction histidine kinase